MPKHERAVVYPGTFDPLTLGHMDILARAAAKFDAVIVAVSNHDDGRKNVFFTAQERCEMVETAVAEQGLTNVQVVTFSESLVECANAHGVQCIIRGLRNQDDFNQENEIYRFILDQDGSVDVMYFMSNIGKAHVSSTAVKQAFRAGVPVDKYVPQNVLAAMKEKYGEDLR